MNTNSGLSNEAEIVASTISSLALLKVNYDQQRKDYFDNFVPMVAEGLRCSSEDVISVPELKSDLRSKFGLQLPQNAIKTILKRASRRGYVRIEANAYYRVCDENDKTDVSPSSEVLRNFRAMGYTKTDVMMYSNNLEKDLKDLRIRVVNKPAYGFVIQSMRAR